MKAKSASTGFIKEYAALNGKTVDKEQVGVLLAHIQKALHHKTDPHGKTLAHIETQLHNLHESMGARASVEIANVKKYLSGTEEPPASVQLLNRYANLFSNYVHTKAEKLHKDIGHAMKSGKVPAHDKHKNKLHKAAENLHKAVYEEQPLAPADVELNGFKGLGFWPVVAAYIAGRAVDKVVDGSVDAFRKGVKGIRKTASAPSKNTKAKAKTKKSLGCADKVCTCHQHKFNGLGNVQMLPPQPYYPMPVMASPPAQFTPNAGQVVPDFAINYGTNPDKMSVGQALAQDFDLIGLDGEYLQLIGEACKPTSFFIYGSGGGGKTTFTVKFADYMADKGNRTLYVAGEQFGSPVFKKLLGRLNIQDRNNFAIVKNMEADNPADYDIIVLDSKDSLAIEQKHFIALQQKYPKQTIIILSQATKDGGFTGSETWRNLVDTMIVCEKGIAYTNRDKNRWGGSGEMRIF